MSAKEEELIQKLKEDKIDVNSPSKKGTPYLHEFISPVHMLKVVKYIVDDAGGKINIRDSGKNTALHIAAKNGKQEVLLYLISKGADLNIQNSEGNTPLHVALESENLDAALALLKAGAEVNLLNDAGFSSFELVKRLISESTKKIEGLNQEKKKINSEILATKNILTKNPNDISESIKYNKLYAELAEIDSKINTADLEMLQMLQMLQMQQMQIIDEYISHVESANYATDEKEKKLKIAFEAKADLKGEDISYTVTNGTATAYTATTGKTTQEKLETFRETISKNEAILTKDLYPAGLTIIGRLFKRLEERFTKKHSQEPKQSLLRIGGFFSTKSHGKALVEAVTQSHTVVSRH